MTLGTQRQHAVSRGDALLGEVIFKGHSSPTGARGRVVLHVSLYRWFPTEGHKMKQTERLHTEKPGSFPELHHEGSNQ